MSAETNEVVRILREEMEIIDILGKELPDDFINEFQNIGCWYQYVRSDSSVHTHWGVVFSNQSHIITGVCITEISQYTLLGIRVHKTRDFEALAMLAEMNYKLNIVDGSRMVLEKDYMTVDILVNRGLIDRCYVFVRCPLT